MKTISGTIHGQTIELAEDSGLHDGQTVRVQVTPMRSATEPRGEALGRWAGALANEWDEEDDRILEEIDQDRKRDPRRYIPE